MNPSLWRRKTLRSRSSSPDGRRLYLEEAMIKSMTGYGGAKGLSGRTEISVELRSVNNRYLDVSVRLPRVYTAAEDSIKSAVGRVVSRGKVDVYINLDLSKAQDTVIRLNEPLAKAYVEALDTLSQSFGIPNDVSSTFLARLPDILVAEKAEEDRDQLFADILSILEEALSGYTAMREKEGDKLRADILSRLDVLEDLVAKVEERSPITLKEYREKLTQKMNEVLASTEVDPQRILTEAAIFADKIAVDEETVRLRSHIDQVRSLMDAEEPVGRKLDFLVQEMNREANTIGSKGSDIEIARKVIDIKAEVEKIREQIQNIE